MGILHCMTRLRALSGFSDYHLRLIRNPNESLSVLSFCFGSVSLPKSSLSLSGSEMGLNWLNN